MKYIENLSWILDNNQLPAEERCKQNIEFVHSLGLKCDSVGWSNLNLDDPRTDEIFAAIDSFCKKIILKHGAFIQENIPILKVNGMSLNQQRVIVIMY